MFKPAAAVALSHQRKGFRQSVGEFALCPRLERTKGRFELCNTFLKGSEVRGVRRDMPDAGSGRLQQLNRPGRVMKRDGVEQDEVARAQAGDQQVLDVQAKDLARLMPNSSRKIRSSTVSVCWCSWNAARFWGSAWDARLVFFFATAPALAVPGKWCCG